jgi:hypothetical protein
MTADPGTDHDPHRGQPRPLIGLPALMQMALAGEDLMPLGRELVRRAEADADDAEALLDLSILMQLTGDPQLGLSIQKDACWP